jgi:ubiquinone biosynthesis monooxygenase Coq6
MSLKVWDGVSDSQISFSSNQQKNPSAIAFMCENFNLMSGLLRRLNELNGVEIIDKTVVGGIRYGEDLGDVDLRTWPVVQLSSGRRLAARLLVGADGANSPVRTFADIESRGWDYGRHGIVATMKLEDDTPATGDRTAFQRFLPTGPVAMLPVRNVPLLDRRT